MVAFSTKMRERRRRVGVWYWKRPYQHYQRLLLANLSHVTVSRIRSAIVVLEMKTQFRILFTFTTIVMRGNSGILFWNITDERNEMQEGMFIRWANAILPDSAVKELSDIVEGKFLADFVNLITSKSIVNFFPL